MNNFWKYKLDHAIFWVTTVVFHMFTRVHIAETAGVWHFFLEIIIRNTLLAVMIYVNLLILIPRFAQRKKVVTYGILLVAVVLLYVACKNAHDVFLYGNILRDDTRSSFLSNSYYNFSIALFYLAFSVALQLSKEWYFQRALIRKIEIEKLNTELQYLKAQINPHFLFNSINTIYFQIDKENSLARGTLSAFSEMLRYQLYECGVKEISIDREINYLKHYVELQKLRKGENYNIVFQCTDKVAGFSIAPLLLIPFIENAFKHVSHYPGKNEIRILLDRRDEYFTVNVFNTKHVKELNGTVHEGIGLKNVSRMLELLYKDRHSLSISDRTESYEVNLMIKISTGEA
jgi:two-component system, LytTR family, sensor kinase